MNIVILDGYTLNPGDLSWDLLKEYGTVIVYDRTEPEKVYERIQNADLVLTNKVTLTNEVLDKLDKLKYVGVLATGYNVIDLEYAQTRTIIVTNTPAYGTNSVAQMVFSHILNLCSHIGHHSTTVKKDLKWSHSQDFCYWDFPLVELTDKTIGIVGFGAIGREVANIAQAFNMKILAYDLVVPSRDNTSGAIFADIATLFRESDIVTLHCPLTEQNKGFINKKLLLTMKKSAFLINTSRGSLIDDQALADVLNSGALAGAGLDVLSVEPPESDNPLLSAKNCYITPHIAWATKESRQRLFNIAVDNIKAFLSGQSKNVVNS